MRLVVFGRTGQVGRALQARGPALGHEVRALGRAEADITDRRAVETALAEVPADLVVNAAAYTAVDGAESDAEAAFAVNSTGAANVAEACAAHGLPLIHFSTDYVFDGDKPKPYVEEDPVNPLGVYGRSKQAGEAAVRAACPRHLVLRTSWVYAADGRNFVRTMLRLAEEREALSVVDDQHGCPTAAGDLAGLVLAIAPTLGAAETPWGTYHAAGGGITTWHGFACEIFRLRGRHVGSPGPTVHPVPTSGYPTPAPRPANSALDCARLHRVFGHRLPPWQDSLAAVLDEIFQRR